MDMFTQYFQMHFSKLETKLFNKIPLQYRKEMRSIELERIGKGNWFLNFVSLKCDIWYSLYTYTLFIIILE